MAAAARAVGVAAEAWLACARRRGREAFAATRGADVLAREGEAAIDALAAAASVLENGAATRALLAPAAAFGVDRGSDEDRIAENPRCDYMFTRALVRAHRYRGDPIGSGARE